MNYTPKNQMKVDGKMSKDGADLVGKELAKAENIAAWLFGFAALITALGVAYSHFIH
jgi:hypothetical protein